MAAAPDSHTPDAGAQPRNVTRTLIQYGLVGFAALVALFVIVMTWGGGMDEQREQARQVEETARVDELVQQTPPTASEAQAIVDRQRQEAEQAAAAAQREAQRAAQRPPIDRSIPTLTPDEARRLADRLPLGLGGGLDDLPVRGATQRPVPAADLTDPLVVASGAGKDPMAMPEVFERARATGGGGMAGQMLGAAPPARGVGGEQAPTAGGQGPQQGAVVQAHPDAAPLDPYTVTRAQRSPTNYLLSQGSIIDVVLVTAINTQNPGQVQLRVVSDVFDSKGMRRMLIPRGTRLIGSYGAGANTAGLDRVPLVVQRVIFTDGRSIDLGGANVTDLMGQAGSPAEHHSNLWRAIGPSALVAWLGYTVDRRLGVTQTGAGAQGSGATQSVTQQILPRIEERVAERFGAAQPFYTVQAGTRLALMTGADIAIPPFQSAPSRSAAQSSQTNGVSAR